MLLKKKCIHKPIVAMVSFKPSMASDVCHHMFMSTAAISSDALLQEMFDNPFLTIFNQRKKQFQIKTSVRKICIII